MSAESPSPAPNPLAMPALIVGVTGSMALDPGDETLREHVGLIFDWLCADVGEMSAHLVLGAPLGLKKTPIVVLSSLAPGADQLVAEVACARGWRVVAPLPFPIDVYRNASTFRRGQPDEDAKRQRRFDSMVALVGAGNCFPVLLESDLPRSEPERLETWRRDLDDRPARNRRYRAAGEYVAAYCDLLVALTDHGAEAVRPPRAGREAPADPPAAQDAVVKSGSKAIIEAKRRGMTPGLLPVTPVVNWADNGPVVNVFVRDQTSACVAEPPRDGTLTLLHPFDCQPAGRPHVPDNDPHWQRAGTDILRRIAANLERLNREPPRTAPSALDAAFATMLGKPPPDGNPRPAGLDGPLAQRLETIARVRRMVADQNGFFDRRVRSHLVGFICLALLTLISLQVYENWVPEPHGTEETPAWRIGFLAAALGSTALAWGAFRRFRKSSLDDRQYDYRAVAEGLRVQFYWMAAGTGESAASDYLQRQRSELSWIRSAISSVSFPYEPARDWFENLSSSSKLRVFEGIRDRWIRDQWTYFHQRAVDLATRRHSLHFLRNVLLTIGVCLLFGQAAMERWHGIERFVSESTHSIARAAALGLAGICLVWLVEWGWCLLRSGRGRSAAPGRLRPPVLHFWQVFQPLCLFGEPGSPDGDDKAIAPWLPACLAVLAGLLVATLVTGAVFIGSAAEPWMPTPLRSLSIVRNLCLGGGGLVHLWGTLKFFDENLRRYDAMSSLFQAADARMEQHLDDLAAQLSNRPASSPGEPSPPDPAGATQSIREIQSLCLALGKEALAENAEWLLMHRDRRLKPVMPG